MLLLAGAGRCRWWCCCGWPGPAAVHLGLRSEDWREAGELARALALYIGLHFVASPLGVVTMAWQAQAWALKLALVGQVVFVAALAAVGLAWAGWQRRRLGGVGRRWLLYFGWYFWRLATWPVHRRAP
jgi:hypothetical protein